NTALSSRLPKGLAQLVLDVGAGKADILQQTVVQSAKRPPLLTAHPPLLQSRDQGLYSHAQRTMVVVGGASQGLDRHGFHPYSGLCDLRGGGSRSPALSKRMGGKRLADKRSFLIG